MVLLSLSVIGISINGFAKNIAQDIAVDTARFAALADQDSTTATDRALTRLRAVLSGTFSPGAVVNRNISSEGCTYDVTVTLRPLAIGLLAVVRPIRESARAICELQG
ncbi:unannotated protein [freshwater metagenome]|uniref:Unannotated protein n=1 Tax=freshwater metagenome TaxID=449393 RepID=A0A6J6J5M0_9ZZZZ|nr:hypothetical protein [Actinomycetota bacterium]